MLDFDASVYSPTVFPIKDLEEMADAEPGTLRCSECNDVLVGDAHYLDDCYYCEKCGKCLIAELQEEAQEFAVKNCKTHDEFPPYDSSLEFRCTPKEYENGFRESYSPNSHACQCRHRYTNYEELIKDLDQYSAADQIQYFAIKIQIDKLVDEKIEEDALKIEDDELLNDD